MYKANYSLVGIKIISTCTTLLDISDSEADDCSWRNSASLAEVWSTLSEEGENVNT